MIILVAAVGGFNSLFEMQECRIPVCARRRLGFNSLFEMRQTSSETSDRRLRWFQFSV